MEEILLKVKKIIASLNTELKENAAIQLELIYDYELERLLNYLNRKELPKGLENTLAHRIAANFLLKSLTLNKFADVSKLTVEDLTSVIELKEYETSIKYGKNDIALNDLSNIKQALEEMKEYNADELHRYRLIPW